MKVHALALLVYLVALIAYSHVLRDRSDAAEHFTSLASIPLGVGEYMGREQSLDERSLEVLAADEVLFREYWRPNGPPIWVFLAHFAQPEENSQIHSPKHCYPGSGWSIYGESTVRVPVGRQDVDATCLLVTNGAYDEAVFYWFLTDSGVVTNEFELKWEQMKNTLLQRSLRSTFVRFSTPIDRAGRDAAEAELQQFIEVFGPEVSSALEIGGGDV